MTISREKFLNFVKSSKESAERPGKSTLYYIKIYDQFYPKKFFISWNWAAFLIPLAWLAYRRMYLQMTVYMLISLAFVIYTPEGSYFYIFFVQLLIRLVKGLFFGVLGNILYFDHIKRCFKKGNHESKAGVSMVAVFVAPVAVILVPVIAIIWTYIVYLIS